MPKRNPKPSYMAYTSSISQAFRQAQHDIERAMWRFPGPGAHHGLATDMVPEQETMDIPRVLGPWKPYKCNCHQCMVSPTPLRLFKHLGLTDRPDGPSLMMLGSWVRENYNWHRLKYTHQPTWLPVDGTYLVWISAPIPNTEEACE